jgi:hypothetical protein
MTKINILKEYTIFYLKYDKVSFCNNKYLLTREAAASNEKIEKLTTNREVDVLEVMAEEVRCGVCVCMWGGGFTNNLKCILTQ